MNFIELNEYDNVFVLNIIIIVAIVLIQYNHKIIRYNNKTQNFYKNITYKV